MKLSEAITKYGDIDAFKLRDRIELTALNELYNSTVKPPPKPKKIDMSVCVESGILCLITKDKHIYGEPRQWLALYSAVLNHQVSKGEIAATPYMDGFIHASPNGWDKCPIPEGLIVRLWDYKEQFDVDYINDIDWSKVTMFQVTGIAEGYTL